MGGATPPRGPQPQGLHGLPHKSHSRRRSRAFTNMPSATTPSGTSPSRLRHLPISAKVTRLAARLSCAAPPHPPLAGGAATPARGPTAPSPTGGGPSSRRPHPIFLIRQASSASRPSFDGHQFEAGRSRESAFSAQKTGTELRADETTRFLRKCFFAFFGFFADFFSRECGF
jgi:hypothetical protein